MLGALSYLSYFFQQDNLDFSQVQCAVEGTISDIKETSLENDSIGREYLTQILELLQRPLIFEEYHIEKKASRSKRVFYKHTHVC